MSTVKGRDIVLNSLKGFTNKLEKKVTGKSYKSKIDLLDDRLKKRLLEATTWYKDYQKESGEIEVLDTNLNSWKDKEGENVLIWKRKERKIN